VRRVAYVTGLVLATGIRALSAQTLTGNVSRGNTPIAGALVVLIDGNGRSIAQTASRENGVYSVTAPAAGSYRAQVLQIGWRPTIAGPFALRSGVSTTANIDVTGARIPLDAIVVTDRSDCRVRPDSAASAFILWDEARKALIAATMTRAERLTMSVSRTEQSLDRSGSRVLWDSTRAQVGQSLNPFFSLAPEALAKDGYATTDAAGNKTYWGPDAAVLLSESFLSLHCIRPEMPVSQTGDSARLIGVAFSPVEKRRNIVEVEGVIWLDRSTAELREIVYHYVNTTSIIESGKPGGRVEFLRIPGGRWIVHRWSIRVPSTVTSIRRGDAPTVPGAQRVDTPHEELAGIRITSGQVSEIRRGSDALWERGRVTLLVRVVDSATAQPIRGVLVRAAESPSATASDSAGGVRLDRITPGPLTLRLESAELESVGRSPMLVPATVPSTNDATVEIAVPSARALVVAQCGSRMLDWGEGLLRGTVATSNESAERTVVVTWQSSYLRLGGGEAVVAEERREIIPSADGTFDVCGIPRDATVTVRRKGEATATMTSRFAPGALAVRVAIH
jgi:carboxypeptidase family protein